MLSITSMPSLKKLSDASPTSPSTSFCLLSSPSLERICQTQTVPRTAARASIVTKTGIKERAALFNCARK